MSAGPGFGLDDVDPRRLAARPGIKHQRYPGQLAAWVADMDFEPCPAIREAIEQRLATGDLGYPAWAGHGRPSPIVDLWARRCATRYGWEPQTGEIREWCDVIQAVQAVLYVATEPGDGIVLFTPSYPPLRMTIESMGRRLIAVAAQPASGGGVAFDYDELEERLERGGGATTIMLCHPHNPTGHVFDRAEIERLVAIAERFDLLIVSDEIHAELTYAPAEFLPVGSVAGHRAVTIHSASKAFNTAGLRYAIAHVGAMNVRRGLDALPGHLLGAVNLIGALATIAAWTDGDEWLAAVLARLDANRLLLGELLAEHLPEVAYSPPQGTYLAWLDCRRLGFGEDPTDEFHRRGVALNPGPSFGPEGAGFARLNFATPPDRLTAIVEAMATAPRP